jgi:hypothetical protein
MNFGKALSFASPLAGMLSGNGAGMLPFLSPGFGTLTGKGWGDDEQRKKLLAMLGGMGGGKGPTGMFGAGMPFGMMGMFGGGQ